MIRVGIECFVTQVVVFEFEGLEDGTLDRGSRIITCVGQM